MKDRLTAERLEAWIAEHGECEVITKWQDSQLENALMSGGTVDIDLNVQPERCGKCVYCLCLALKAARR